MNLDPKDLFGGTFFSNANFLLQASAIQHSHVAVERKYEVCAQ